MKSSLSIVGGFVSTVGVCAGGLMLERRCFYANTTQWIVELSQVWHCDSILQLIHFRFSIRSFVISAEWWALTPRHYIYRAFMDCQRFLTMMQWSFLQFRQFVCHFIPFHSNANKFFPPKFSTMFYLSFRNKILTKFNFKLTTRKEETNTNTHTHRKSLRSCLCSCWYSLKANYAKEEIVLFAKVHACCVFFFLDLHSERALLCLWKGTRRLF